MAFRPGIANGQQYWFSYPDLIANSTGVLNNVWSNNTYNWTGAGGWFFMAGNQGNHITQAQWTAAPYLQDASSTFGGSSATPTPSSTPTPTPSCSKIGDINCDGAVNIFDLSILLSDWGTSSARSDLNHDGTVNIFDLSILLSHWGT